MHCKIVETARYKYSDLLRCQICLFLVSKQSSWNKHKPTNVFKYIHKKSKHAPLSIEPFHFADAVAQYPNSQAPVVGVGSVR